MSWIRYDSANVLRLLLANFIWRESLSHQLPLWFSSLLAALFSFFFLSSCTWSLQLHFRLSHRLQDARSLLWLLLVRIKSNKCVVWLLSFHNLLLGPLRPQHLIRRSKYSEEDATTMWSPTSRTLWVCSTAPTLPSSHQSLTTSDAPPATTETRTPSWQATTVCEPFFFFCFALLCFLTRNVPQGRMMHRSSDGRGSKSLFPSDLGWKPNCLTAAQAWTADDEDEWFTGRKADNSRQVGSVLF